MKPGQASWQGPSSVNHIKIIRKRSYSSYVHYIGHLRVNEKSHYLIVQLEAQIAAVSMGGVPAVDIQLQSNHKTFAPGK